MPIALAGNMFEHSSNLGNASAQSLFALLRIEKKDGSQEALPPRDRSDYLILFDGQDMPPENVDETREIASFPGVRVRFFPVCWHAPN